MKTTASSAWYDFMLQRTAAWSKIQSCINEVNEWIRLLYTQRKMLKRRFELIIRIIGKNYSNNGWNLVYFCYKCLLKSRTLKTIRKLNNSTNEQTNLYALLCFDKNDKYFNIDLIPNLQIILAWKQIRTSRTETVHWYEHWASIISYSNIISTKISMTFVNGSPQFLHYFLLLFLFLPFLMTQ